MATGVPPAVEDGILPSGKTVRLPETSDFARLIASRRFFRRAGRTGSTSAKMADATIFRQALRHRVTFKQVRDASIGSSGRRLVWRMEGIGFRR